MEEIASTPSSERLKTADQNILSLTDIPQPYDGRVLTFVAKQYSCSF